MANRMLKWFSYDHLPSGKMKEVSARVANLALQIDERLGEGPEKTAGLRKLLEAKDCFVRQAKEDVEAVRS